MVHRNGAARAGVEMSVKVGHVKSAIPCSGEWVAVYAREGKLRKMRGRVRVRASDFGTEPVAFWLWTEEDDVAEFVGVVPFGGHMIIADDPYLLGYARKGESLVRKFGPALRALKRAERLGGFPEAQRGALAELIRETPTYPCPTCDKGVDADGDTCKLCGGAGVLPGTEDKPAIAVVDKTKPELN